MPAFQKLLFEDPRPLVERLGIEFFRTVTESPGVYLMRGEEGKVLYVGKARNLRKRLHSYRVANPDRLARRHLRLLRAVVKIDVELLPDESSALKREAELLLELRPPFNRAGVWRPPETFLIFRSDGSLFRFQVASSVESGWHPLGVRGSRARFVQGALARLLWLSCDDHPQINRLPAGWFDRSWKTETVLDSGAWSPVAIEFIHALPTSGSGPLSQWITTRLAGHLGTFDQNSVNQDLEFLSECWPDAATSNEPPDPETKLQPSKNG